jgi:hypothetical protein
MRSVQPPMRLSAHTFVEDYSTVIFLSAPPRHRSAYLFVTKPGLIVASDFEPAIDSALPAWRSSEFVVAPAEPVVAPTALP